MLTAPRVSQAHFPGSPSHRLYFISFESSYVGVSVNENGSIEMDVHITQEPPEGVLGEWIEQVSKDATSSFGGDPGQLASQIIGALSAP